MPGSMSDAALSAASLTVLRDLRRADGKQVLRLAFKELVARGVYEVGSAPPAPLGWSRRRLRPGLHPTGRLEGGDALLTWVDASIRATEVLSFRGRPAYLIADTAVKLKAGSPEFRRDVIDRVLADLHRRGLVVEVQHRWLRRFRTIRWTRTERGDARLALGWAASPAELGEGAERELDAAFDTIEGGSISGAFDTAFDDGFADGGAGDGGDGGGGD